MLNTLVLFATLTASAAVGEVFGDVRAGDAYVKEAALELKCGDEVVKGKTDATGSFRLSAKASGKCTISITHEGQSPSVEVVLFEKAARYRLMLEKKGESWTLRRV